MRSHILDSWATDMYAEGKAKRTVKERLITLARMERDIGSPALDASRAQIAEWLARPEIGTSTKSVYHSHLSAFYRWAILAEYRVDDPMMRIRAAKRPRRRPRPIAIADYERARDAGDLEMRAMLMLFTLSGFRDAEVARFHSRQLDAAGGIIEVAGKGGTVEIIHAHPDLLFIARRMPRGYWFPSSRPGHPHIGGRVVWQRVRLHLLKCGVHGTPHQLRHTFGTELLQRGADVRVVQELMRHADLATTAGYTAVTDGRKRDAINTLPSIADTA